MRIKTLLLCLLVLACCGLLVVWQETSRHPRPVAADAAAVSVMKTDQLNPPPSGEKTTLAADHFPQPVETDPAERAAQLQTLAAANDAAAADEIISALTDPDARVRTAACAAAVQCGNRNLIPALQAAADGAGTAREKMDLLAAAEFLQLPTMSEALAAR
jgi:hypothetical protein